MEKLFKEFSKSIRIYMGISQENDPFEHDEVITELPPLPIKALITDLVDTQIAYKMPGIITERAKEIIIKKKYRSLIEKSQKIKVDNDYFEGWRVNGRLQIREIGEYIRCYIYST